MDIRRIATIALSSKDYPSFEEKLNEAVKWVEHAAAKGARLAVLPEAMNLYRGDGACNSQALAIQEEALVEWKKTCASLLQVAKDNEIALTIPVFVRSENVIYNSFFFISEKGECIGEYRKQFLTPNELESGVRAGESDLIIWDGLKVGGAICFDSMKEKVFTEQADRGARLILMPSLWPGGAQINHWCRELGVTCAIAYPAWSRIVDIDGKEKVAGGYRNETLRFGFGAPVFCADINFDCEVFYANENQEKIVDVEKYYGERILVDYDQDNCSYRIESVDQDLAMSDIKAKFELITRNDYIEYCRELNQKYT